MQTISKTHKYDIQPLRSEKVERLYEEAVEVLKTLIRIPSLSGNEDRTAEIIENWLKRWSIPVRRSDNNVWAVNANFDENKPTFLLNSHHDTVKPNANYTRDPFEALVEEGKLYGLGSNDAGGCLVSLAATFIYFYDRENIHYNIVFVASAEEESSGSLGLNSVLDQIPAIEFAVVGEPTELNLAIAEKGLLVLDGTTKGTSGHAAHCYDDMAIYNFMESLKWFRDFEFDRVSDTLGTTKMTVTQIQAGKQHNVVPGVCSFVVDVRVTDAYTNEEIVATIQEQLPAHTEVTPRSMRLRSSSIPKNHPLVEAGIRLGKETYGSPTLSDQSVLSCPSLKVGPGDSKRSHTADEFIFLDEIKAGISLYIQIIETIL